MKPVLRAPWGVAVGAALVAAAVDTTVGEAENKVAVETGVGLAGPVAVAIEVGLGAGEAVAVAGREVGVGIATAALGSGPSCFGFLTSSSVPAPRTWSGATGPAALIRSDADTSKPRATCEAL